MMYAFARTIKRTVITLLVISGILAISVAFAWWSLRQGLDVRQLSLFSAEISNLSIQLDLGFIIHVEQIDIAVGQAGDAGSGLERHVSSIQKWGHLIREIDIGRLNYQEHAFTVSYRNGQFLLENDRFVLKAAVAHAADVYHIALTELLIKPHDLTVNGTASYNRSSDRFIFSGLFEAPLISGSLHINEYHGEIDALVSTGAFAYLAPVLELFPIDREVVSWVADNITAGQYRIKQLRLQFPLEKWRNIGPDQISGSAVAESAAVKFHPEREPVLCDTIDISLRNDRLAFLLEAPRYKGKNLSGSSVYIDNLMGKGTQLVVHLKTKTEIDEDVREVLRTYYLRFPFLQLSGATRADLRLTFDLPQFTFHGEGAFSSGPGEWAWDGVLFHADGIQVALKNRKVTIQQAEIAYRDILRGQISGIVDVQAKEARLDCNIDNLGFSVEGTRILHASGVRVPVAIDFGTEPVAVHFKEWQTVIRLDREMKEIAIGSLRAVTPVVPLLGGLRFNEGYLRLAVPDKNTIRFNGEIEIPDTPLILDNQSVSSFRFQGGGTPGRIEASINEDRISVTVADRVTVRLRDYLVAVGRNAFSPDADTRHSLRLPLTVTGPKALLILDELMIPTGTFEYNADGQERTFEAGLEQGRFLYEVNGEEFKFTGKELNAEIAHHFIKFADFGNGTLNVTLNGTAKQYNGYMEFNEVLIRDYLVMNNIIAFLNTVPALATLSSPGFDQDGYRVQEGFVHFDVAGRLLTIRQLRADGITVNCEASGWVDFNDRTLHLSLELFTMKDYSRIIGLLPLAGYAILGEDGSLSTSLEITGSLDEPEIQTNLAMDILLSPLHIIRRTIEWPFRQLEKLNGRSSEPPEPD
jgi:hypothetical protein